MGAQSQTSDDHRRRRLDAWRRSAERPTDAELVPIETLRRYREYDREIGNDDYTVDLRDHIATYGICESIKLEYDPDTGIAHIGEGNHRLTIAEELGITHLPVEIYRSRRRPNRQGVPYGHPGAPLPQPPQPDATGYVPGYMKPSEVGLPVNAQP